MEICKNKKADYLIFIDDDETAQLNWLSNLINTSIKYGSKVVSGPGLFKFEKKINAQPAITFWKNLQIDG